MDTDEEVPKKKTPPTVAKSPAPGAKRTKCKYWNKCYRKDKGHKALYIHPGDPDEKQAAPVNVKGMPAQYSYGTNYKKINMYFHKSNMLNQVKMFM